MTQLDRIEAKLDWIRWRMRWGEIERVETTESGHPILIPRTMDPEPRWPDDGRVLKEEDR